MNDKTDKKDSDDKILGTDPETFGLVIYYSSLGAVLNIIDDDFYPLSFPAFSVIFFTLMLIAYPIFVRNSKSFRPILSKSHPFFSWCIFSIMFSAIFSLMLIDNLPLPLPAYSAILLALFSIFYPIFIRYNPNRTQIRGKPFGFIHWFGFSVVFVAFFTFIRYAFS